MSTQIATVKQLKHDVIAAHMECLECVGDALTNASKCGSLLAELRGTMSGQWVKWVENNLPFTYRTACRYIRQFESTLQPSCDSLSYEGDVIDALLSSQDSTGGQRVAKEGEIIDLLRTGMNSKVVSDKLSCGENRVGKLFNQFVLPEFLQTDWVAEIKSLGKKRPAFEIAKRRHLIIAHRRNDPDAGRSWYSYAAEKMGADVSKSDVSRAAASLKRGLSAHVIKQYEDGAISMNSVYELSELSEGEQAMRAHVLANGKTKNEFDSVKRCLLVMRDAQHEHESLFPVMAISETEVKERNEESVELIKYCDAILTYITTVRQCLTKEES